MVNQIESKISKLGESVAGFTNTLNCETVKANNESRKQVKKMEELEKKLASVVKETNNKVVSEDNGCDNKVDQSTKKGPNTKDWIEEEKIILGFENDCNRILIIHQKFDLDDVHCDKCQFKSHSQGLLRMHKQKKHNSNDTFVNIIEGFKNDIEDHVRTLEAMCEEDDVINRMKCDQCEYKNNSEGNLRIHKRDVHNQI